MNRRGSVKTTAHEESSTVGLAHCDRGICTSLDSSVALVRNLRGNYVGNTPHVSNSLPIPFVPDLVSYALGLVLMTWGMVALWWLVFKHERLSLRQIALPWWIGLIGAHQ